jgi:hypothetical protein
MTFSRIWSTGTLDDVSTITAAQATSLDGNIVNAIDMVGGGTLALTNDINITDGSGGAFGDIDVHGYVQFKISAGSAPRTTWNTGTIPVTNSQNIGITYGQVLFFADHTGQGQKDHDMDNTGAAEGDWITFIRDNTGINAIVLWDDGHTGAIVTLAALAHRACTLFFDGTAWRLGTFSAGCTPGALA